MSEKNFTELEVGAWYQPKDMEYVAFVQKQDEYGKFFVRHMPKKDPDYRSFFWHEADGKVLYVNEKDDEESLLYRVANANGDPWVEPKPVAIVEEIVQGDGPTEADDSPLPLAADVLTSLNARLVFEAADGQRGDDQQRLAQAVLNLGATLLRKNYDYGSSAWKRPLLESSLPPATAIRVRMSDKIERIISLANKSPEVAAESMDDTLQDLVGYWILLQASPKE